MCTHGKWKRQCIDCGGSALCAHARLKYSCKECKVLRASADEICTHGRLLNSCKEDECRALHASSASTTHDDKKDESFSELHDNDFEPRFRVDSNPTCDPDREDQDPVADDGLRRELEFGAWLASALADAAGRVAYPVEFGLVEACVMRWRQRFYGDPKLWKRLMKARLIKEIVECVPVIAAAIKFARNVQLAPSERLTVIDLCSGKGFLSMFLSEILPADSRREVCAS